MLFLQGVLLLIKLKGLKADYRIPEEKLGVR